jgi:hypothetical protein
VTTLARRAQWTILRPLWANAACATNKRAILVADNRIKKVVVSQPDFPTRDESIFGFSEKEFFARQTGFAFADKPVGA